MDAFKAFQAYAKNHGKKTATTPREAATEFFAKFPAARKCDVTEGEVDGLFFTVRYSRGAWPQSWKGVTRKQACDLPGSEA